MSQADPRILAKIKQLENEGVTVQGFCPKCLGGTLKVQPSVARIPYKIDTKRFEIESYLCLFTECDKCGYVEMFRIN